MMNVDLFSKNLNLTDDFIYEVQGLPKGDYDKQSVQYDKVISNSLYNRIMWGNHSANYTTFSEYGLKNAESNVIADIGCGTLSFTASAYAKEAQKEFYFCDLSHEMLRIGKKRLQVNSKVNTRYTFVRADALEMPFKSNVLQTVFCFGILHLFSQPEKLVIELNRMIKPGGKLFLTSLCTNRKWSSIYLNFLFKKGHVAKPMSSHEIQDYLKSNGFNIESLNVVGGMTYIEASKM